MSSFRIRRFALRATACTSCFVVSLTKLIVMCRPNLQLGALTRYLVNKITIIKRKAQDKKKKSEFQGKATSQVTLPKRPLNGIIPHVAQFPYTSKKF